MGQYFVFLNLDKRQHWRLGKLGESIFDGGRAAIFQRRYVVHSADEWKSPEMSALRRRYRREAEEDRRRVADPVPRIPSVFMRLSNELKSMVFEHINDLMDAVCLALTCKLLWNIGAPTTARLLNEAASWSGDRVICVGDYTRYDDLPANLLTDAERTAIEAHMAAQGDPDDRKYCYDALLDLCVSSFRVELYNAVRMVLWDVERNLPDDGMVCLPSQIWTSLVSKDWKRTGPRAMILRNLDTREYVRGAELLQTCVEASEFWDRVHQWDFGDLLLLRVCWSSDPSCSLEYGELRPMTRGPWAGHRFDIVDESDVVDDAGWKDVSSELMEDLLLLFESEYDR